MEKKYIFDDEAQEFFRLKPEIRLNIGDCYSKM